MKAFHGKQELKDFYIERLKEHARADEIIKGQYWINGKGCAVGCTIHGDDHSKYETELGISRILARLEDNLFERLPNDLAKTWPLRFLDAINVGADLSKVWPKFAIYLLADITQCNLRHPQCILVAEYFQKELDGEKINWLKVRNDAAAYAADAGAYAADAAAYAAAAAAAAAYAYAAAADAADAAAAAAADAAAYAYKTVKEKAIIAQSEKLLELLRDAK